MNEKSLEEFEMLLIDWEEGSLDPDGVARLRQLLKDEPSARQRYVELQMLAAAMHLEDSAGLQLTESLEPQFTQHQSTQHGSTESQSTESQSTESQSTESQSTESQFTEPQKPITQAVSRTATARHLSWATLLIATAASLLICIVVGRWMIVESRLKSAMLAQAQTPRQTQSSQTDGRPIAEIEATSQGVALVTRLVDVRWPDQARRVQVGDALTPGRFDIEAGFAQIEFFCGATVVLQGPAELELESSTTARLFGGQLRAQVPPVARGFLIHVDDMEVVDLGTEFGISATPDGTGVQVFDGEVELLQPSEQKRLVTAGHAVHRGPGGELGESTLTPDQFVDLEALDSHANSQTENRYQRWRSYSQKLRKDPRLIMYYAMEGEQWNRKLRSSLVPENRELDGAIVGARRVPGRWPDKKAIEFKHPGDRVRVDIPGEFESLTFACWVKIDSLDRWYNSLFLTDSYERGEPHWQILDTGQLFFSVRVREGEIGQEHREVLSPPFWKPSMSGQWLHLATTYDVAKKQTTHYLNGTVLSRETIPDVQLVSPTRIGKASIGNWSLPTKPDAKFAIRNLNGSLDEFALFGAALTPQEILEIYEIGKP